MFKGNKMKYFLSLFFIFSVFTGCKDNSTGGGGSGSSFVPFPLKIGTTWVYTETNPNGTSEKTYYITDTIRYLGNKAYLLSDDFMFDNDVVFMKDGILYGAKQSSSRPMEVLFPKNPKVGQTWVVDNGDDTLKVISKNESVTVTAGTFSCYKITVSGGDNTLWWANGKGVVKFQGNEEMMELKSFSTSDNPPVTNEGLIPLKLNNTWEYQIVIYDDIGDSTFHTLVERVTRERTINGSKWYNISDEFDGEVWYDSTFWVANKSGGMYVLHTDSLGNVIEGPLLIYKYPIASGEKFVRGIGDTVFVISTNTAVDVNAGHFSCIHYQWHYGFTSSEKIRSFPERVTGLFGVFHHWFAERNNIFKLNTENTTEINFYCTAGKGWVKTMIYNSDGSFTKEELQQYTLY